MSCFKTSITIKIKYFFVKNILLQLAHACVYAIYLAECFLLMLNYGHTLNKSPFYINPKTYRSIFKTHWYVWRWVCPIFSFLNTRCLNASTHICIHCYVLRMIINKNNNLWLSTNPTGTITCWMPISDTLESNEHNRPLGKYECELQTTLIIIYTISLFTVYKSLFIQTDL